MNEQNNLQNNNENNNNDNNMILSTNSTKNNPIVNTLIEIGFDPAYSKRIFKYFHPENIEVAIEYLSIENGFIQHIFVQDKNTETDLCYACGKEKKIHINSNIQLNNNNEEDNKNININNIEVKSDENEGQKIECSSCDELFIETKENKLEKCGHSFCNVCWFGYFSAKINENKIGLIKCIEYECEEKPDDDFVINLIKSDQNLVEKYKKFKYELEIINNQNKKFCPFPNCNSFLELKDINNKEVKCSNNHAFCFICLEEPHGNSPCKENLLKSSMIEYSKNNLIKKCPKCSVITEKITGCNHISCTKCNYQWCWLCNGEYDPEHYERGKCKGYQFFRPQNEEEIKLALEGKIKLRESQRQEDSEDSDIIVNLQNNSFDFQQRNLLISSNDIPDQKKISNSVNLGFNSDDEQIDDDNIMNSDENNENEIGNSISNNNMSNEQNNSDFNNGNNESGNLNNNNDNLINNRNDDIENKSEDKGKSYNINNSNRYISNEINNNEKKDLIDSSYNSNKIKGNNSNIQNINNESNNVIEQNINNDLNQSNLDNKNYGNFINYNTFKNNNNNFNNNRYFRSSEKKDDFENKYKNKNIKNSISNHENTHNDIFNIKNTKINQDNHLINNDNNNKSNANEVGQVNPIFIYNKNNIIDDDKKEKVITSNKLMQKENRSNNKININNTLNFDDDNSESRFKENNAKKDKKEIKNSQLSISYKVLLTIFYILFGHCFILTNRFLKIIKKDYYKLPFLFIIIPYFFIQIYINILLLFPYIFKGFNSFLSEFFYIIKFKYNNLDHFHSITDFSYYSAEILFLGTFLLLIKLISKLLHKKNIFIILFGIILGIAFLPFHIIINIIMLIFAFCLVYIFNR